jgi:very-short-patch-repair endonuclease
VATLFPVDLASRQAGVLHRRQLRESGVGDASLRRRVGDGRLRQIDDHVFVVPGSAPTWHQRIWIELHRSASPSVVGFRTASQLHHVGRLTTSDVDVLELEPMKHHPGTRTLHRSTRLPAWHVTAVDGIPVTTVARTIFDLASLVSPARRRRGLVALTDAQVERALDDAMARGVPLEQFERVLASLAGRGRAGTRLMRDLVLERSSGEAVTESELEDLVEVVLSEFGIELPSRQVSVGGTEAPVGRVDFVFRHERVVLEADGRRHHTALRDAEADRWRDLDLAAAGYVAIRVTQRQLVHEPGRFARGLDALLAARREPVGPR